LSPQHRLLLTKQVMQTSHIPFSIAARAHTPSATRCISVLPQRYQKAPSQRRNGLRRRHKQSSTLKLSTASLPTTRPSKPHLHPPFLTTQKAYPVTTWPAASLRKHHLPHPLTPATGRPHTRQACNHSNRGCTLSQVHRLCLATWNFQITLRGCIPDLLDSRSSRRWRMFEGIVLVLCRRGLLARWRRQGERGLVLLWAVDLCMDCGVVCGEGLSKFEIESRIRLRET